MWTGVVERIVLDQPCLKSGVSLLFAAGGRPSIDQIDAILRVGDDGLPGARISHAPPADEGWVEVLASGLTFELHGLSPAAPMPVTPASHSFGFDAQPPPGLEAIALIAGSHIAGGSAMIPVVRTITGIAANLAVSLPIVAVCWEPADSWMEPRYFSRAVIGWLTGGPFPVLGLTAIVVDDDFVTSAGLAFFAGQEIRVAIRPGESVADTVKLAIRVIDNVVRRGAIVRRTELDAASGTSLIAEPSADGALVTVWRGR